MDEDDFETADELLPAPRKDIRPADRELLEIAARALGAIRIEEVDGEGYLNLHFEEGSIVYAWNSPVHSDNCFNLASDLELDIMHHVVGGRRVEVLSPDGARIQEFYEGDRKVATRCAVTRAAGETGSKCSDRIDGSQHPSSGCLPQALRRTFIHRQTCSTGTN